LAQVSPLSMPSSSSNLQPPLEPARSHPATLQEKRAAKRRRRRKASAAAGAAAAAEDKGDEGPPSAAITPGSPVLAVAVGRVATMVSVADAQVRRVGFLCAAVTKRPTGTSANRLRRLLGDTSSASGGAVLLRGLGGRFRAATPPMLDVLAAGCCSHRAMSSDLKVDPCLASGRAHTGDLVVMLRPSQGDWTGAQGAPRGCSHLAICPRQGNMLVRNLLSVEAMPAGALHSVRLTLTLPSWGCQEKYCQHGSQRHNGTCRWPAAPSSSRALAALMPETSADDAAGIAIISASLAEAVATAIVSTSLPQATVGDAALALGTIASPPRATASDAAATAAIPTSWPRDRLSADDAPAAAALVTFPPVVAAARAPSADAAPAWSRQKCIDPTAGHSLFATAASALPPQATTVGMEGTLDASMSPPHDSVAAAKAPECDTAAKAATIAPISLPRAKATKPCHYEGPFRQAAAAHAVPAVSPTGSADSSASAVLPLRSRTVVSSLRGGTDSEFIQPGCPCPEVPWTPANSKTLDPFLKDATCSELELAGQCDNFAFPGIEHQNGNAGIVVDTCATDRWNIGYAFVNVPTLMPDAEDGSSVLAQGYEDYCFPPMPVMVFPLDGSPMTEQTMAHSWPIEQPPTRTPSRTPSPSLQGSHRDKTGPIKWPFTSPSALHGSYVFGQWPDSCVYDDSQWYGEVHFERHSRDPSGEPAARRRLHSRVSPETSVSAPMAMADSVRSALPVLSPRGSPELVAEAPASDLVSSVRLPAQETGSLGEAAAPQPKSSPEPRPAPGLWITDEGAVAGASDGGPEAVQAWQAFREAHQYTPPSTHKPHPFAIDGWKFADDWSGDQPVDSWRWNYADEWGEPWTSCNGRAKASRSAAQWTNGASNTQSPQGVHTRAAANLGPRIKRHSEVPKRKNLAGSSRNGCEKITTLMIRNLPNQYNRELFMQELDETGFKDRYDFVYLPIDNATSCNVGYAFVNFQEASDAVLCVNKFQGRQFARFRQGYRTAQVSAAHLQGLQQNLEHHGESTGQASRYWLRPWVRSPTDTPVTPPIVMQPESAGPSASACPQLESFHGTTAEPAPPHSRHASPAGPAACDGSRTAARTQVADTGGGGGGGDHRMATAATECQVDASAVPALHGARSAGASIAAADATSGGSRSIPGVRTDMRVAMAAASCKSRVAGVDGVLSRGTVGEPEPLGLAWPTLGCSMEPSQPRGRAIQRTCKTRR